MKKKHIDNKAPNAVFKKGMKTAKTDTHYKHRSSVFGTSKPRNPLAEVIFDETVSKVRLNSSNRSKKQ